MQKHSSWLRISLYLLVFSLLMAVFLIELRFDFIKWNYRYRDNSNPDITFVIPHRNRIPVFESNLEARVKVRSKNEFYGMIVAERTSREVDFPADEGTLYTGPIGSEPIVLRYDPSCHWKYGCPDKVHSRIRVYDCDDPNNQSICTQKEQCSRSLACIDDDSDLSTPYYGGYIVNAGSGTGTLPPNDFLENSELYNDPFAEFIINYPVIHL